MIYIYICYPVLLYLRYVNNTKKMKYLYPCKDNNNNYDMTLTFHCQWSNGYLQNNHVTNLKKYAIIKEAKHYIFKFRSNKNLNI